MQSASACTTYLTFKALCLFPHSVCLSVCLRSFFRITVTMNSDYISKEHNRAAVTPVGYELNCLTSSRF